MYRPLFIYHLRFYIFGHIMIADIRTGRIQTMAIRPAGKEDITAVSELYEKIHDAEQEGIISTGWLRGVYPVRETAEAALKRGDLFVEEQDGKIVGSAVLNRIQVDCYSTTGWKYTCDDSEVMVMHTLNIDPLEAGKGYGKAFVEYYEKYAKDNGCKVLRIDTQERNTCARALYRKCGFIEAGTCECVFNGIPGVRLVMLEKAVI